MMFDFAFSEGKFCITDQCIYVVTSDRSAYEPSYYVMQNTLQL